MHSGDLRITLALLGPLLLLHSNTDYSGTKEQGQWSMALTHFLFRKFVLDRSGICTQISCLSLLWDLIQCPSPSLSSSMCPRR